MGTRSQSRRRAQVRRRALALAAPGRRASALIILLVAVGCRAASDPPGRTTTGDRPPPEMLPMPAEGPTPRGDVAFGAASTAPPSSVRVASRPDAAHHVVSIAMHTWIYQSPTRDARRIGYLRAGAMVSRAPEPDSTEGCPEGFYRVAPRGYVCVGKTASLDLAHEVRQATPQGPRRGEPFPYSYVVSRAPPPHRYVRLPTREDQRRVEGRGRGEDLPSWALRNAELLGSPDAIPPFFESRRDTPKPFGAEERVRFDAHRGRAKPRSAFGLSATYEWLGRRYGLTTELDLIPIDRTNVVRASTLHGLTIRSDETGTPAFVTHRGVGTLRRDARGRLVPSGAAPYRSGWLLTGRTEGDDDQYVEATDGAWLPRSALRIATLTRDLWGHADAGRRWIDVSIDQQLLVAYEGRRPVFAALVSTGKGGVDDPETTHATVQGTFFIEHKHITDTMDGDATDADFDLHDVPYVQYFHRGYALHGAYWHDDFGKPRSSGCVNLAPQDAAWLFEWTDPPVPEGWHAVVNRKRGTLVYIHP
jgi:hypothetical protein